ncbi:MAG: signal peptidase I [Gammaproteobacteria bacterium]|nr:signal peptidase I [Gammaproteobacteria bacterium]
MVHFDFELLLLILTVISGVIWLADVLLFARVRQASKARKVPKEPIVIEYSRAFFPVLAIVLVLRAFAYEPFRIPSGSMMPTLLVGDFILVNKYSYGFRMPVWHNRINFGDRPERGDVVVFRYPRDESQDYIKRVIGLPGDHISYYNRRLSVNGKPLKMTKDGEYQGLGDLNNMPGAGGCDRKGAACQVYVEGAEDSSYTVMTNPNVSMGVNGEVFVPNGHYFVMGDNRSHSNDSRLWGFVPEDNLVGKAVRIWMHWDWRKDGTGLDVSRIGQKI